MDLTCLTPTWGEGGGGPWGSSGCWRSSGPIRMTHLGWTFPTKASHTGLGSQTACVAPASSEPVWHCTSPVRCPSSLKYSPHRIVRALNEVIFKPISHNIYSPRSRDGSQLYLKKKKVPIMSSEAGHTTFKKYIVITDYVKFFCAETL